MKVVADVQAAASSKLSWDGLDNHCRVMVEGPPSTSLHARCEPVTGFLADVVQEWSRLRQHRKTECDARRQRSDVGGKHAARRPAVAVRPVEQIPVASNAATLEDSISQADKQAVEELTLDFFE